MAEKKGNENLWVNLCHLTALSLFIGIPFGNILGPFIIWIIKKDEFASVDKEGKKSINFQISMTLYMIISGLLIFAVIGIILLPLIVVADLVLIVIAVVKINNKEEFNYPLTIKFIP
ncbi:MAG: DUF4870 domain-containing protein [bacterium]